MLINGPITASFIAPAVSAKTLGKRVIGVVLYQNTVGADAGMA
jgi:hypothetical protein